MEYFLKYNALRHKKTGRKNILLYKVVVPGSRFLNCMPCNKVTENETTVRLATPSYDVRHLFTLKMNNHQANVLPAYETSAHQQNDGYAQKHLVTNANMVYVLDARSATRTALIGQGIRSRRAGQHVAENNMLRLLSLVEMPVVVTVASVERQVALLVDTSIVGVSIPEMLN